MRLVGYSVGARVIFYALQELWHRRELHVVADVYLMGAPVSHSREKWQRARTAVSGRFVNGYCRGDWVLGFFYRYMEWGIRVAGLSPVSLDGVEEVDLSTVVSSHTDYPAKLRTALALLVLPADAAATLVGAPIEAPEGASSSSV